ncbi:GNAT family N-acetyltransferase [Tenacibaculum maritimum]|uniref:GNAT family N-acetyltransferase n=1 Tax=Tenacibaculum maritimum TaxID=107401 RepID=UPI003876D090
MIKAEYKDKDLITDILTDSFKENKSIINVTRKGKNQLKRIRKLMTFFFINSLYNGDVFISDNKKACLLMLVKNGDKKRTIKQSLILLYWKINLFFNILGVKNVKNVIQREKAINSKPDSSKHLHLYYVGVYKEFQGNSTGTNLINEAINYYNGFNSIYLETSDKRNLSLYKRLGFTITKAHKKLEITLYILKKKLNV